MAALRALWHVGSVVQELSDGFRAECWPTTWVVDASHLVWLLTQGPRRMDAEMGPPQLAVAWLATGLKPTQGQRRSLVTGVATLAADLWRNLQTGVGRLTVYLKTPYGEGHPPGIATEHQAVCYPG